MRRMKKIVSLMLFAGLIAVAYALFAAILTSSDHAYYITDGKNLDQIDYDKVISNAKKAYVVDGPYYVNTKQKLGLHLSGIRELDERLGDDYRILWIRFYYEDSGIEISFPEGGSETKIRFFNTDKISVELKDLPPDEWIIDKFKLFGFSEQKARDSLSQLKDAITGYHEPKILIKEVPDFQAIYIYFKETGSNSTFSLPAGEGSCKETFYRGDEKIGEINYVVQNTRITYHDGNREYTVKIDRLGGVMLNVKLPAGEDSFTSFYFQSSYYGTESLRER